MNWMENLVRPELVDLIAYSSARKEAQHGEVWLNANENPYAFGKDNINRYPEPQPSLLINKLSQIYKLQTQQLLITRGSDEGIDLLIRTFCRAYQDNILICPPTYGMYEISAKIQGANVLEIPLQVQNNFALDMDKILTSWNEKTKLIFLCSPNNPTGNILNVSAILQLCESLRYKALIVVDEAYIEFSNAQSLGTYLNRYENLIILRTLSKAYGLAAVRIGAVLAHAEIIKLLNKVIAPYPIPTPVTQAINDCLAKNLLQQAYEKIFIIKKQRQRLYNFFISHPDVIKAWPSEANFLLVKVRNAQQWLAKCQQHQIVIRDRSTMLGLTNCLRISIGTEQENDYLHEVLNNE